MREVPWIEKKVDTGIRTAGQAELVGISFPLAGINDMAEDEFTLLSPGHSNFAQWTVTGKPRKANFEKVIVVRPQYGHRGRRDKGALDALLAQVEKRLTALPFHVADLISACSDVREQRHTLAFEVTITGGREVSKYLVVFPDDMNDGKVISTASAHATNLIQSYDKGFAQCLKAHRSMTEWNLYAAPD